MEGGGRKGVAGCSGRHTALGSYRRFQNTLPGFAGKRRRGSGAINHWLPREGRPLRGGVVSRVQRLWTRIPAPGSAVAPGALLPSAQGRAADCSLAISVPGLRGCSCPFTHPAGAAWRYLQPGATFLGKVETTPPPPSPLEACNSRRPRLPWSEKAAVVQPCC